jgi:hypothetical protein
MCDRRLDGRARIALGRGQAQNSSAHFREPHLAVINLNPAVEIIRASQALELASEIAVFINCGAVGRSSFASRAYASTAGFRIKGPPPLTDGGQTKACPQ